MRSRNRKASSGPLTRRAGRKYDPASRCVNRVSALIGLVTLSAAAAFLSSCEKETAAPCNLPPDTVLEFTSGQGDTASYRVLMRWSGTDPDGRVSHYLARWDTTEWFSTTAEESLFVVSTSGGQDSSGLYEAHRFSVKAVDDEGAEDRSPAFASFTARNRFPETTLTDAPQGEVGSYVEFRWAATDEDGEVAGYTYELSERAGSDWSVIETADLGATVQFMCRIGLSGEYRFRVWARDASGGEDPTPATCEFTCDPELKGPLLTLDAGIFGTHTFRGHPCPVEYWVPISVFEGEHQQRIQRRALLRTQLERDRMGQHVLPRCADVLPG